MSTETQHGAVFLLTSGGAAVSNSHRTSGSCERTRTLNVIEFSGYKLWTVVERQELRL